MNKKTGIYHVTNSGECSWFSFAKTIFKEAGANPHLVKPITTEEYGALAPRPRYSVLGHHALMRENVKLTRHWKEALKEYIRKEVMKIEGVLLKRLIKHSDDRGFFAELVGDDELELLEILGQGLMVDELSRCD